MRGKGERSKGVIMELGLRSRKGRLIWTITRETGRNGSVGEKPAQAELVKYGTCCLHI